jgi:hypothetical protein
LADGSPYIAEELSRDAAAARGESPESLGIQPLVRAIVERTAHFDAATREIVQLAAVLGRSARFDDFALLGADRAEVTRALGIAREAGVLFEPRATIQALRFDTRSLAKSSTHRCSP